MNPSRIGAGPQTYTKSAMRTPGKGEIYQSPVSKHVDRRHNENDHCGYMKVSLAVVVSVKAQRMFVEDQKCPLLHNDVACIAWDTKAERPKVTRSLSSDIRFCAR